MGLGTYGANKVLDLILGTASWTLVDIYVSLHSAAPGLTGANEFSASWYTTGGRKQPSGSPKWNAATTSGATNNGAVTFPTVSGSTLTATHIGFWDSATVGAGNFIHSIQLTSPKQFASGSIPIIASGAVTIVPGAAYSNYLIPLITDQLTGRAAMSLDSTLFLALYTTNPTAADSGTECTLGGYVRKAWAADAAASGATQNASLIDWGTASSGSNTITHWGIRTASSGGSLHIFGAWDSAQAIGSGDAYSLQDGDLDLVAAA